MVYITTCHQHRFSSLPRILEAVTRSPSTRCLRRPVSRSMATVKDSIPHVERTAHEPRQAGLWTATLSKIDEINSTTRLLRLSLPKDGPPLKHLPGQYVDLHIPTISTVGGFTITSPPQTCLSSATQTLSPSRPYFPSTNATDPSSSPYPYIELAIQDSPSNPPAAFLWRAASEILHTQVSFRVGGNFIFPPINLSKEECEKIDNVVFVAGGVGVNPIISMIAAMDWKGVAESTTKPGHAAWGSPANVGGMRQRVRVLYSSKREHGGTILFEERLQAIARRWQEVSDVDFRLASFETGPGAGTTAPQESENEAVVMTRKSRRITHEDLFDALGPENQRQNTVVYVCGVPGMTDEFVHVLRKAPGMDERRVLCEKWW